MKTDLDRLKKFHITSIEDELSGIGDDKWSFWSEFDSSNDCFNIGIFIYDEDMYHFAKYAQRGGIITGSKFHFENLKQLGYDVVFHSWYQENVFILIATIPSGLMDRIALLEKQAKLPR